MNAFLSFWVALIALSPFMLLQAAETKTTISVAKEVSSPVHQWQLLLFTIPGCSSCITMRHQVIEPMIEAGFIHPMQFSEVIQVSDADWHYVRGLGYDQIRNLKVRYKTSLFPTLVAIDAQGNKIAENIVGMTSVEHYRTKLEQLIIQLEKKP
jgi:thioredoxin-related protein